MHHNPRFNPQADVFMPERFMGKKDDEKDVYDLSFGFGRRYVPMDHSMTSNVDVCPCSSVCPGTLSFLPSKHSTADFIYLIYQAD